jgi:hypothetical protein
LEEDCGGLVLKLSSRIVHSILWIFAHTFFWKAENYQTSPTYMVWVFGTSFFWKEIALEVNQIYLSFLKLATSRDRLWVQFLLAFTLSVTLGPFVQHTNHFPATTLVFFGSL